MKKVLLTALLILNWRVTGERPIPCSAPKPDAWGLYREKVININCAEKFRDWKLKDFETKKELDEFLKTKPAEGVEVIEVISFEDKPPTATK